MIKELQWYNIATLLRDYLKSFRYSNGKRLFECMVDRDDLTIHLGTSNTGEYPAIDIIFGDESDPKKQDDINSAIVQLWIDIYVKGEATADINANDCLYRQLFNVENEFCTALRYFNNDLHKRGLGTNCKVLSFLSDGDTQMPANGMVRAVIEIEWRK